MRRAFPGTAPGAAHPAEQAVIEQVAGAGLRPVAGEGTNGCIQRHLRRIGERLVDCRQQRVGASRGV